MRRTNYSSDLKKMIQLASEGRQGAARKVLSSLNLKKIPRNLAVPLADLARRLNMPKIIITILKPIVRPDTAISPPPTDQEKSLYATGLSRLGVFDEALKILQNVDEKKSPQSLLFLANIFMLQWDYDSALPLLARYAASDTLSTYERLVAEVNLAATYIWNSEIHQGEKVLNEVWSKIKVSTDPESLKIIHGYSYELAAESAILKGEWDKGQRFIKESESFLSGTQSRYEFYLKKWKAVLALLKDPKNSQSLNDLRHIKQEALKLSEWEIARDCDFFEALALRNNDLFLKVYHGSPFPSYRKRILRLYNPQFTIPEESFWTLGEGKSPVVFDVDKFEVGQKDALINTPILFSLFKILIKDFYKPVALGTVFSELYVEEHYNAHSSPLKVQQIVKRLRKWFEVNKIPLEIIQKKETLSLQATRACTIKVSSRTEKPSKSRLLLLTLKEKIKENTFTSRDAIAVLGLPPRTVQRLLNEAVQAHELERLGTKSTSRYKF